MEKKTIKISLSTFFLILTLITIAIMGYFLYKTYKENILATKEIASLNNEVSILKNTVNTLQSKIDNITSKVTSIEGEYLPVIEGGHDSPSIIFSSNGNVEAAGNYSQIGTYIIENDIIKIKYTKLLGPDVENQNINEERELRFIDEKTILDEKYGTIYKKSRV